jgi:hypothetical protein
MSYQQPAKRVTEDTIVAARVRYNHSRDAYNNFLKMYRVAYDTPYQTLLSHNRLLMEYHIATDVLHSVNAEYLREQAIAQKKAPAK